MYLNETGCEGVQWIQLVQNMVQYQAYVNIGSIEGGEFFDQLSNYLILKDSCFME
jgi:hypothetical protein